MRWPWQRRRLLDRDTRQRVDALQERIDQQVYVSEQVAQSSRDLTEKTAETREWAAGIRKRNHITEGLQATYKFRKRRRKPWTA